MEVVLDEVKFELLFDLRWFLGGEVCWVVIVCLLVSEFDILLLDEFINYLDFNMIEWLEKRLNLFLGVIIMISYDCIFLCWMINVCFWFDWGWVCIFNKGYVYFDDW